MRDPPSWERNFTNPFSFKKSIEGISVTTFIKDRSRIKCGMTVMEGCGMTVMEGCRITFWEGGGMMVWEERDDVLGRGRDNSFGKVFGDGFRRVRSFYSSSRTVPEAPEGPMRDLPSWERSFLIVIPHGS